MFVAPPRQSTEAPLFELKNNSEGGTPGSTVTTSDTGSGDSWNIVNIGSGAGIVYTSSALQGNVSTTYDVGVTSTSAFTSWNIPANATHHVGFWFSYPSTFGGNCSIFSLNSGGTALVRVQITTANKLRVLDAAGATAYTSTATFTPTNRYYASMKFVADVNGSFQINIYDSSCNLIEVVEPTAANFSGPTALVRYGCITNQTSTNWRTLTLDDVTYNNRYMPVPAKIVGSMNGTTSSVGRPYLYEDFEGYETGELWYETEYHGNWQVQPSGNQVVQVVDWDGGDKQVQIESADVGGGGGTAASLVTSLREFDNWSRIVFEFKTDVQFRTPTPNVWEVLWSMFNFKSVNRFYFVAIKPDGWEITKEWHNGVSQQQDFLAYSFSTHWPVGNWMRVTIDQSVSGSSVTLTVTAEDLTAGSGPQVLATVTDDGTRGSGPAYPDGKVCMYSEDARGRYRLITVDGNTVFQGTAKGTGALAGTTGNATGAFAGGTNVDQGQLAGTTGHATGAFTGTAKASGTLAGTTHNTTGTFAGTAKASGALAGTTSHPTAALAGTAKATGTLAGTTGHVTGALAGSGKASGSLAGTVGATQADINGTGKASGAISGAVQPATADINETSTARGPLAGTTGNTTGQFSQGPPPNVLNGVVGNTTGALAGSAKASGALFGTTSGTTAALTGIVIDKSVLSGAVQPATADINGTSKATAALAGTTSGVTADLNGTAKSSAALAGSTQRATADINGQGVASGSFAGAVQPTTGHVNATGTARGLLGGVTGSIVADINGEAPGLEAAEGAALMPFFYFAMERPM